MCGICGIVRFDGKPVGENEVGRMGSAITHRGPDDSGICVHEVRDESGRVYNVGLGHCRLSVIDLSASGHQPMCNEDGTIWIIYNGETYNFRTLRKELEKKGHVFKSNTDTEVVLHLYEEEGTDAVCHLNGMFAFAILDLNIGRVWLCRDRIGIKPLVYFMDKNMIVFASEIKALLTLPEISRTLDRNALDLYLAFNYVPAPYTMFEGIKKLEPAHSLVLRGDKAEVSAYWSLSGACDPAAPARITGHEFAGYKRRIVETMTNAVTSRMISDVPLGAFLSGGIDSSIVVALMARNSSQPVKTFSIGFSDAALFDETRYARQVAHLYQTDHHEFKLTETDMLVVLEDVLAAFDEPFADSSAIPSYIVSMHTKKHVTVALSGDGGDELFAGYRSYLGEYWHPFYEKFPFLLRRLMETHAARLPDSRDVRWMEYARRIKKFVNAATGTYEQRLLKLKRVFPAHVRSALLGKAAGIGNTCGQSPHDHVSRLVALASDLGLDPINRMLYTDLIDSLPCDMLTKVDITSMAHALEVRTPFLDHNMVELAFSIPAKFKIRGMSTKYILKKAFAHMLPKSLLHRPKAGFEIPIGMWLKGDLSFLIDDYLGKNRIDSQGIFDYAVIEGLRDDLFKSRADTSWMLWNLIVFEHWYDRNFQ
ncbi:MAG: asparagine synthase (glutamine-hydrolyzing) [Deltaproteobacteria bacterium]|nr:asparagine synthase (glutamine-hydrolyzing) [Deltaproteobacteria bacterium]